MARRARSSHSRTVLRLSDRSGVSMLTSAPEDVQAIARSESEIPAHRAAGVRDAIHQAGAELRFLPPYSPDFNPIELAFSKFKAHLKRDAARTVGDIWDAIANAADIFTQTECENYFAAAGYDCE